MVVIVSFSFVTQFSPYVIDSLTKHPSSFLDDAVTMQAQRSAPSDLPCKDKFLVQSTVVPFGTTGDDITSGMVRIRGYRFW